MKDLIKSHKKLIVVLILIAIGYWVIRLPMLTSQPVFADEAIYIRWAQIMRSEPSLRFLPVTDGKTPLYMWTLMPMLKLIQDPLLAGRLLSVIMGFGTWLGIVFLSWRWISPKAAVWSGLLAVTLPYLIFFERMALADSMLTAFTLWSLIGALLLAEFRRLDLAMVVGYLMGGAVLAKTPGSVSMWLLPATGLVAWAHRLKWRSWSRLIGLWVVVVVIALACYNLLRLGPEFRQLSARNQDYLFPVSKILATPWDPLLPHLNDLWGWCGYLLSWPLSLLVAAGGVGVIWKRRWPLVVVAIWAFVPLVFELLFIRNLTARYAMFMVPMWVILAGWMVWQIEQWKKWLGWLLVATVMLCSGWWLGHLWFNVEKLPLPANERQGYFQEWTAGYGLEEISQFLINEAAKGTIQVGTEGAFGTLPDGLTIYLDHYLKTAPEDKKIIVSPGGATVSAELRADTVRRPVYFVSNSSRYAGTAGVTETLLRYPKLIRADKTSDEMLLMKVLPEN